MEDQASETVVIDNILHPGISVISINRPERRNAVDAATAKSLYDAIIKFEDDITQKVCILTGTGGTFCSGADLHRVAQKQNDDTSDNLQPVDGRNIGPMGPSRLIVQKNLLSFSGTSPYSCA